MKVLIAMTLAALTGLALRDVPERPAPASPLRGTWNLQAADRILTDGSRVRDYGEAPKGRLIVDAQGRYSLQIFKSERPRFVAAGKAGGSADEFAAAVLGSSTHYGTIESDAQRGVLRFRIEGASFPNWEGSVQQRSYTLEGNTLSYRVPPRPDGSIPVSVWLRLEE